MPQSADRGVEGLEDGPRRGEFPRELLRASALWGLLSTKTEGLRPERALRLPSAGDMGPDRGDSTLPENLMMSFCPVAVTSLRPPASTLPSSLTLSLAMSQSVSLSRFLWWFTPCRWWWWCCDLWWLFLGFKWYRESGARALAMFASGTCDCTSSRRRPTSAVPHASIRAQRPSLSSSPPSSNPCGASFAAAPPSAAALVAAAAAAAAAVMAFSSVDPWAYQPCLCASS
mmetsp:Transcript_43368/g.106091  ORF Transcript_43368/g.106091 Transcript_43368/m.106091 type:complete len:229 (+) Transcript_43368:840-1526(+)